jgi:hypothetical protein
MALRRMLPVRDTDNPIPGPEWLYRAISEEDVVQGVVGHHSIDLPACSCDRDKYAHDPRDVLQRGSGFSGVAATRPESLPPGPFMLPPPNPRECTLRATDAPENTNPAHSEIRLSRHPGTYGKNWKPPRAVQIVHVQQLVAGGFRIVMRP